MRFPALVLDFCNQRPTDVVAAIPNAQKELKIRTSQQTYSWYDSALFENNEPAAANKIYILGKALEGLELYYM